MKIPKKENLQIEGNSSTYSFSQFALDYYNDNYGNGSFFVIFENTIIVDKNYYSNCDDESCFYYFWPKNKQELIIKNIGYALKQITDDIYQFFPNIQKEEKQEETGELLENFQTIIEYFKLSKLEKLQIFNHKNKKYKKFRISYETHTIFVEKKYVKDFKNILKTQIEKEQKQQLSAIEPQLQPQKYEVFKREPEITEKEIFPIFDKLYKNETKAIICRLLKKLTLIQLQKLKIHLVENDKLDKYQRPIIPNLSKNKGAKDA